MENNEINPIQILLIDDNEDEYLIICRLLSKVITHFNVKYIKDFNMGLEEITINDYDVCLLDYRLGTFTGIDFIKEAVLRLCNTPIILLTGHGDHEIDVAAMKAGASDFLDKGLLNSNILERTIRYALERKKSEEKIRYLAYYDQLTNLPNRTLFMDRIKVAISAAKRYNRIFAVLFIDIDNFKIINDSLGHSIGDKLIVEIAHRFLKCIRNGNPNGRDESNSTLDTVARMGGDEFTILLSEIKESENASKVAERIQRTLLSPIILDKSSINVTISIGISIFPDDGGDIDTIIKHADLAMYNAKSLGKNTFQYFNSSMNVSAKKRLSIEHDLLKAIEENQLCVYYQPIIDIKSKKIVELEALLRWRHPEKGMILPMDFIPIAEENGLILRISEQVLHLVGNHYKKWRSHDLQEMRIAINISPKQLNYKNFLEKIHTILQQYNIPPGLLSLEITESTIINNIQIAYKTICEIKKLGVRVSLDDFGSGYSSFITLKQIPFDIIKIDRSYITTIPDNIVDTTITASIILIGHSMGLKVVAEGVETESQLSFVKSHGCDMVQGYYYHHPLPEEEIVKLFQKQ